MRDRQDAGKESASRQEQPQRAVPAPESGVAAHLLHLQRTLGNAAVARMIGGAQGEDEVQRSTVHGVLRSSGQPLDAPTRDEMEARMGADFSDVRLHTGSTAQRSAAEIGARAYTSGNHVVLGSGASDKHTLAHELTHVLQQRSGPVAGTDNGDGLKVSDPSDRFEREAETTAAHVLAGPVPEGVSHSATTSVTTGDAVQRNPDTRPALQDPTRRYELNGHNHPADTGGFLNHVYLEFQKHRNNIKYAWNSNFAVLKYLDKDGNVKYADSFNASKTGIHSEAAIIGHMAKESYQPLALFTDNSPCLKDCQPNIDTSFRSSAKGVLVPIFYIADWERDDSNVRHGAIRDWWQ